MARIAIVTDSDTGLGFGLTGIDVYGLPSPADAEKCIGGFLGNREYGIVAYSEDFRERLPESLRKKVDESRVPIFVAVPSIKSWKEGEAGEEYIARVLQRALGFYVKIRR